MRPDSVYMIDISFFIFLVFLFYFVLFVFLFPRDGPAYLPDLDLEQSSTLHACMHACVKDSVCVLT